MSTSARGRVAFALACRDASDDARDLVAAAPDRDQTGHLIRSARMLRAQHLELVHLAVLIERAEGASWDELAAAVGLTLAETIARYQPTYEAWQAALAAGGDPADSALALDAWLTRRRDPWEGERPPRPVSRVLDA